MNCPQAAHNLSNRNHSVLCLFVDIHKRHEKLVHSIPEDTEEGVMGGDGGGVVSEGFRKEEHSELIFEQIKE